MGPGTALLTTLRRSFQFSGRSIRSEFWWSWIILYGVATLILMYRGLPLTGPRTDALLTIALCVLALPMMAVGTRRLADAGVWRWLFVLTIALGTATQLAYMYAMPTATDFAMMTFQAERNDVNLPLSGYELLNNVLGDLGALQGWQPWFTAALPGLIYSAISLAAFSWLVLRR